MHLLLWILLLGLTAGPAAAWVNLTSFTATPGDAQANFEWTTAGERGNWYFEFYRNGEWTEQTTGQGNTDSVYAYRWTDAGLTNGVIYYYTFYSVGQDGFDSLTAAVIAPPHWVALVELRAIGDGENINVLWTTHSEIGNGHFEILRDGVLVATEPANNRYVGAYYYIWADSTISDGNVHSYQLVAVHEDGRRDALGTADGSLPAVTEPELLPTAWDVSAYPNPFNPVTRIRVAVPQAGPVRVAVYDLLGREVRLLADRIFEAGAVTLPFDARGQAAGIYFVQVQGPGFAATRKLILAR